MKAAVLLPILFCLPAARAASPDAADLVRQGIASYEAGDYPAAARAFRSADVARPDDPRIAFDMATAEAAAGDADKAVELFRQAALARDQRLAAESHYNLGTLAAGQARALFGEAPQNATPEVRQKGLGLLGQAVAHYRDCLDVDEHHAAARHNLETIRLWIKHMEALWAQRDRRKQRDEMGLLEFLAMIEARQRELRLTAKALESEPDSPRRRQELSTAQTAQRLLGEEIEPLKEKIAAALEPQQPPGQAGIPPTPSADAEKAAQVLARLADDAGTAMSAAADRLAGGDAAKAVERQTGAVDKLDQIYLGVVPFVQLVQRAIATQQGLIDEVTPAAEEPDDNKDVDLADPAWNQGLLARWAEILPAKAQQELEQIESGSAAAAGTPAGSSPAGQGPDPEAIAKQLEGIKQSLQKAVELGSKVHEAAADAAARLDDKKPALALPAQEESLKLLKEIADPLPKQDQQQGDDQKDQKQDNQSQQQQQQQQGQQQGQPQDQQPRDLSEQQAEAVMRKVRERQRERDEMQKQLQRFLSRPGEVERDW
jgi:hypothetical protein